MILAAAWGDMLSVEEIADEIEKSLDFLAAEMPDMPRRHWDIRAMLQFTWERLSEAEQDAFMKMSIFRGGCSREAAEQITGANLRTLMALVNKALIKRDTDSGRFSIHELLRQYAAEQLQAQGTIEATQEAHFEHYSQMLIDYFPQLVGAELLATTAAIEVDFENYRAAWDYAVDCGCIERIREMTFSFNKFANTSTRFHLAWSEMLREAAQKLEADYGKHPHYARLLSAHAWWSYAQNTMSSVDSDIDKAIVLTERALKLVDTHDMTRDKVIFLTSLAWLYSIQRRNEEGWQSFDHSESLAHELGDPRLIAEVVHNKIMLLYLEHNLEANFRAMTQEALELHRDLGDQWEISIELHNLGVLEFECGNVETGLQLLEEALAMKRLVENKFNIAKALDYLGLHRWVVGNLETAIEYREEAISLFLELNNLSRVIMTVTGIAITRWVAGQQDLARIHLTDAEALVPEAQIQSPRYSASIFNFHKAFFAADYRAAKATFMAWLEHKNFLIFYSSYPRLLIFALCLSHTDDEELSVILMAAIYKTVWFLKGYEQGEEYQDWLSRMQATLGQEVFDAAWEHGTTMNIKDVQQLLEDEFGREES